MKDRTQLGFSLTEMTIVVALFGLVAIAAAAFVDFYSSSHRRMDNAATVDRAVADIELLFSQPKQCMANLCNTQIVANGANPPSSQIGRYDSSLITNCPIPPGLVPLELTAKLGARTSDALFDEMKVVPIAQISATLTAVKLNLKLRRFSAGPSEAISRSIDLLAKVQAGRLIDCWVRAPSADAVHSQICFADSQGFLDTWDGTASPPACSVANAKWYPGSTTSATCPAGTRLPTRSDSHYDCKDSAWDTVNDNNAAMKLPVAFVNGGSVKQSRDAIAYRLDVPSNTCQCATAVDLPASNFAGSFCSILCVGN